LAEPGTVQQSHLHGWLPFSCRCLQEASWLSCQACWRPELPLPGPLPGIARSLACQSFHPLCSPLQDKHVAFEAASPSILCKLMQSI
jgi:hypothetical protein